MGAFKIQTDLDLSGFNLLNFCIQSYTDLENVPNLGLGRKLFFTGNSTDEKNLREVIWNGVEWKAAVYLDDIEALTNGEGSLGTRVKALEDMLGLQDVTDVIDTWNDVKAFFANVDEGLNLMTMLDGKLDKKGGTISGALTFEVTHAVTPDEGINFGQYAHIGASSAVLGLYSQNHIALRPFGKIEVGEGLEIKDDFVLFNNNTLLHSGNVGDYTVGAAKKLETAVSLWGNEFDGTQSLNGDMKFPNNTALFIQTSDKTAYRNLFYYDTSNTLYIGRDAGENGEKVAILGSPLAFGTSRNSIAMTITEEGNVSVGGVNNQNIGAMFAANGLVHIQGGDTAVALGERPNKGISIGYAEFGLSAWVHPSTGEGNIQVGRFDGTATAYALNLNPLGGAVNVGGNLAPNANNSLSFGTSNYRWSDVYSVGGNFSGRVLIGGAEDDTHSALLVKGGLGVTGNTFIYNNDKSSRIVATIANNIARIYSLSQDGSVTRDMYFGDYSGRGLNIIGGRRVLIGGAADDGKSALQVAGLAAFNGGALIPTGQTLTIGSVTFRETAEGEVEVDGNLHTTGTLASGGKATVGEGDNGGGGNANVYSDVLEGVITQEWEVGNPFQKEDVIVSLYMWNTDESRWEMVLADIGVTSENIWVTFGRPTSTTDKYMAVVMG